MQIGSLMQSNSYYNRSVSSQQMAALRISTGQKINSAKDDAASLAISESLRSQFTGLDQAANNMGDSKDLLNVSEGAMGDSSDITQRMRTLTLQASNGTLTDSDRSNIQIEMTQLKGQIDSNANNTHYNGIYTNNGTLTNFTTQTGANSGQTSSMSIRNMSSSALGITGDVSTQAAASNNLNSLDNAIDTISSARGDIGAMNNRFDYAIQNATQTSYNEQAAYSIYRDTDVSSEISAYKQASVQTYANMMAMSSQMQTQQNTLSLLV